MVQDTCGLPCSTVNYYPLGLFVTESLLWFRIHVACHWVCKHLFSAKGFPLGHVWQHVLFLVLNVSWDCSLGLTTQDKLFFVFDPCNFSHIQRTQYFVETVPITLTVNNQVLTITKYRGANPTRWQNLQFSKFDRKILKLAGRFLENVSNT